MTEVSTMSKEELLARISEILPDDANIVYGEVTWWNEDGTLALSTGTQRKVRRRHCMSIDEMVGLLLPLR